MLSNGNPMKILSNKTLTLCILLALYLGFVGCASNRYTVPKTPLENFIWTESKAVLRNIAISSSEANKARLESIEIYLNRNSFTARPNYKGTKMLVPAQGNLMPSVRLNQESYLKEMCLDDQDCQVKQIKYYSIHILLHELYHVIHKKRYDGKTPGVFVKKPHGTRKIMSFAEEMKAESAVVKYLSIYDPALLEAYKVLFVRILEEKKFNMDAAEFEQQWDGFKLRDYRQINNARLYFFVLACGQIDVRSLEEVLFEK